MSIDAKVTSQQISASVSDSSTISVNVGGGFGPPGASGSIAVSAPITNSGTSSAAVIGISVGDGLAVSSNAIIVDTASSALTSAFMSAFVYTSVSLFGAPTTLTAARARLYTASVFAATSVTLPVTGNQLGDRLIIRGGNPVVSTITILGAQSGTETITASNQQINFRFQSTGAGNAWVKDFVDKHTHSASEITSGQLANARMPSSPQFTGITFGDGTQQTTAWIPVQNATIGPRNTDNQALNLFTLTPQNSVWEVSILLSLGPPGSDYQENASIEFSLASSDGIGSPLGHLVFINSTGAVQQKILGNTAISCAVTGNGEFVRIDAFIPVTSSSGVARLTAVTDNWQGEGVIGGRAVARRVV